MNDLDLLTQQFCDDASYIKGYAPATIKRYKQVLGQYRAFSGVSELDAITNEGLRTFFLHGRTERHWQANTYINHHKTLTVFLRWCRERGYTQADPIAGIDTPRLPERIPKKLTKQQAQQLLEVVENLPYPFPFLRHRNYAIFQMFMLAGIRRKELINLRLVDIDTENLTIFIRQGKGGKDRMLPMNYTLAYCLKRYLTERKKLTKTCPAFFVSSNCNRGFGVSGLKRLVERVKEASGIHFHIHMLRHTFATLMLEGGCDIYSLSRMMGHSDIKTTTIYLSASAEHLRAQATKHPLDNLG